MTRTSAKRSRWPWRIPDIECYALKHQHRFAAPIIMLTGNESDQQRTYAEFLGVDVYLNKPVGRTHLLATVNRFCPLPVKAIVP